MQVILLLKASDRIAHDISQSGPLIHPKHKGMILALRKWHNLRAEGELRGFVRDCKLVGMILIEQFPYDYQAWNGYSS